MFALETYEANQQQVELTSDPGSQEDDAGSFIGADIVRLPEIYGHLPDPAKMRLQRRVARRRQKQLDAEKYKSQEIESIMGKGESGDMTDTSQGTSVPQLLKGKHKLPKLQHAANAVKHLQGKRKNSAPKRANKAKLPPLTHTKKAMLQLLTR